MKVKIINRNSSFAASAASVKTAASACAGVFNLTLEGFNVLSNFFAILLILGGLRSAIDVFLNHPF